jgi:F-box-like
MSNDAVNEPSELSIQPLPPELLSEIFLSLQHTTRDVNTLATPLLLGQVCSFWRNVAYRETPRLWTDLSVVDLHRHCTKTGFAQMREWVARAHPHPLSITFHYNYDSPPRTLDPAIFAQHFLQLVGNVRSLGLILPRTYFTALSVLPLDAMPLLEEVTLYLTGDHATSAYSSSAWTTLWPASSSLSFQGCSQLKQVCIGATQWIDYSVLSAGVVEIPWPRLTSLSLDDHDITTIQARNILYKASKLTTFELLSSEPVHSNANPVPLPLSIHRQLQTLNICMSLQDLASFFQPFAFPALVSLSVEARGRGVCASQILLLQQRSRFSLTSLNLSVRLNIDALILFLRPLDNLRKLELNDCRVLSKIFVQELTYSSHQTPLVAGLERLVIVDSQADVADDLILDMLESRQVSTHKLEEATLLKRWSDRDGRSPSASAAQRVIALQTSGLQLEYPPFTEGSDSDTED